MIATIPVIMPLGTSTEQGTELLRPEGITGPALQRGSASKYRSRAS